MYVPVLKPASFHNSHLHMCTDLYVKTTVNYTPGVSKAVQWRTFCLVASHMAVVVSTVISVLCVLVPKFTLKQEYVLYF